jgi:hypothetical protein
MITIISKSTIYSRRANGARYFPIIRPRVSKESQLRAVCSHPMMPTLHTGGYYRQETIKKRP